MHMRKTHTTTQRPKISFDHALRLLSQKQMEGTNQKKSLRCCLPSWPLFSAETHKACVLQRKMVANSVGNSIARLLAKRDWTLMYA